MATVVEDKGDARADHQTRYAISVGDVFRGSFDPANDRDWVAIELRAGTFYEIRLDGVEAPALVITDLDIFDTGYYLPTSARFILAPFETSKTYYIEIGSYAVDYSGDYELSITEYTPSTASYDELAGGMYAGGGPPMAFDVGPGGALTADITALTADGQQLARRALEAWTGVTGITFELVDNADAHITFDDAEEGGFSAFTAYNDATIIASHVNVSEDFFNTLGSSMDSETFFIFLHEIGHALGLYHPGPYGGPYGEAIFLNDSWQATVMSYFSQGGHPNVNASYAVPVTPMIADIIAIHELYGAPTGIRAGDTVYGYQSDVDGYLGEFFEIWTGEGNTSFQQPVALTLYDTGGNDTLDLRTDTTDQRVDLRPAGISDVYGLVGNLVIARDTLIENFIAGSGRDAVTGNAVANRLEGRGGDDELRGGQGDDVLVGGAGADRLDGGPGLDWASYAGSDAGVTVNLGDGTPAGGHAEGDVLIDIENLRGSAYRDELRGNDEANHLDGGEGDDGLWGNGGNDVLEGGAGNDRLDGGPGLDWASYAGSDAGVTVNLSDGTLAGGDAEGDVLVAVENLRGSAYRDELRGNDDGNHLDGGAGDDGLWGNAGNDVLAGGAGNDRLHGGPGEDTASYARSAAGVTVRLHAGLAQGGDAEGDTFAGLETLDYLDPDGNPQQEAVPDIEHLRGSAHADVLAGDRRANRLEGGDGDDKLYGGPGGGDDALLGGPGKDALFGGVGDDVLDGGPGADVLTGGGGGDRLDGGADADWISYRGSDSGVRVLLRPGTGEGGHADGDVISGIEHIEGSAYADVLGGDSSDNHLVGGEGDDGLWGSSGADVLEGGAGADRMFGSTGTDWVIYAGSDTGVTVTLQDGIGAGGHAEGDTITDVENIRGSDHHDILSGDASGNELVGGNGDDELRGNAGNDLLDGGAGGDRLDGGAGVDTVVYRLSDAAVVVNLSDGTAAGGLAEGDVIVDIEVIVGSAYSDTLVGDEGINRLEGQGGNDVLEGAAGADRLDGGAGTDTVVYQLSDAAVAVDLSDGTAAGGHAGGDEIVDIENVQGSNYNDALTGDAGPNRLVGGAGEDELRGGGGNDELLGGSGNDLLEGGAGIDRLDGGAGLDTVTYSGSKEGVFINLPFNEGFNIDYGEREALINIENVIGSEFRDVIHGDDGASELYGGRGNDSLYGNAGDDRLFGEAGDDELWGLSGADRLEGGEGADRFIFSHSDGDDIILDFTDNEDLIDLTELPLSGFDALVLSSDADGVTIDLTASGGGTILLEGFDIDNLDASDFIF